MSLDLNVDREPDFTEKEPDFKLGNRLYYSLPDGLKMVQVGGKEAKDIKMDLTDTPLKIVGFVRGDHHGLLVQVGERELVVNRTDLSTTAKMSTWLLDNGVRFSPFQKVTSELLNYFQRWNGRTLHGYTRNGWHADDVFVVGETVVNDDDGIATGNHKDVQFQSKGTFEGWRDNVLPWASRKPGWMFGLLVSLSPPVLRKVDAPNGACFHMFGETSRGKTDAGWLGASCWGMPDPRREGGLVFDFSSPSIVAPEIIMGKSSDVFACFDEIKKPKDNDSRRQQLAASFAYMVANGKSVPRGQQSGEHLTETRRWNLNVLTIGEASMEELVGKERMPAGAAVRLFDINCDQIDLFPESCMVTEAELDQFHDDCRANFGTAGPELVRRLLDPSVDARGLYRAAKRKLYQGDDTRLQRIAGSFATLVVTGDVMGISTDVVFDVFEKITSDSKLEQKTDDHFQNMVSLLGFLETNMNTSVIPLVREIEQFEMVVDGVSHRDRAGWVVEDDDDGEVVIYLRPEIIKDRFMIRSKQATYTYWEQKGVIAVSPRVNGGRVERVPGLGDRARGVRVDLAALRELVGED